MFAPKKKKKKRNSRFGWKSPSWWVKSTQYIKFNEGVNCPLSYDPYYPLPHLHCPRRSLCPTLCPWTSPCRPFFQAEYLCLVIIRNKSTCIDFFDTMPSSPCFLTWNCCTQSTISRRSLCIWIKWKLSTEKQQFTPYLTLHPTQ